MLRKPDVHLQLAQLALGLLAAFPAVSLFVHTARVYHIQKLPVPCIAAQQTAFFRGLQQYIHFHLHPGTFRFPCFFASFPASFEGSTPYQKGACQRMTHQDELKTNEGNKRLSL